MNTKTTTTFAVLASFALAGSAMAQDLPANVKKLADGVYVVVGDNFFSNSGIVVTQDGVVVIDTGQNPVETRKILDIIKKITPMPVRLVIDSEPHPDHTTGHFLFPGATIVAAAGGGESMRNREKQDPERIQKLAATSPAMKTALEGYKFIPPHLEYQQKAALAVGGRNLELTYMPNVHSEADTAVWLPNERIVFSASGILVKQINIFRPNVTIPDILAASKMLKGLNPQHVVPGHGVPGGTEIFDETDKYYALLVERVEKLVKEGKTLEQLQKEVKMPEYASWANQERFPTNVEAAYRMLTSKK
jgi:cyclase